MEFRELKTFQVVASVLSFNGAADVLHLAQSTVSAQIRSLENSLGKELFLRSGRSISLTPAGEKLLAYAQRLINMEKEIQSVLGNLDETSGNLTIKTPQSVSTYFFPDFLKEFQLMFPKVSFDIDWCTSHNLVDLINSGTIDLAFLITEHFEEKNLRTEKLTRINLVLAANPEEALARKKNVNPEDFNDKTLIYAKSECNYMRIMKTILIQSEVSPRKVIAINSLDAIKRMLIMGEGIAFIPEMVIADEVEKGLIKKLDWAGPDLDAKLVMIRSKDKHISEPLKAFMIMVKKMVAGNS